MTSSNVPASRGEAEPPAERTVARDIDAAASTLIVMEPARKSRVGGALLLLACILAGLGVGFLGGRSSAVKPAGDAGAEAARTETPPAGVDVAQLREELRALRAQVESLRHDEENTRAADRLRALEAGKEAAVEAGKSAAALTRRVDKVEDRLAKLERPVAGVDPTPTGAVARPEAKIVPTPPAPRRLTDFVLRDVANGAAFVERGDGLIEEVTPGDSIPGAGRVTAIERRGPRWVVVTTRGVIDQRAF